MAYGSKDVAKLANDAMKKAIESKKTKTLAEIDGGDRAMHVAEVVFEGESITLPIDMTIQDGIMTLVRRMEYMEKQVTLKEILDVFPYDGALALDAVLTDKYGWSQASGTPGWFGENPPQLINIQTGPDTHVRAPWGSFVLPNVEGSIYVGTESNGGRFRFTMQATVKRKDEATINDIFKRTREYLKENSIYRGKAIKIKFRDEAGEPLAMPEPEFIDTRRIDPTQLILSKSVMDAIDTNLFTPIRRVKDCILNGIPVKRGVLLGGAYGTGKTLAASVASHVAVESGITYVYIPRAPELAEAIEFAKQYQSPACVIFCEDVDRVLSGKRDANMDEILNLIDGIDTKNSNIIVVVTTNELNSIEPAMLRPGRLDAVIEVTPPDAEACERLLRHYGKDAIHPDTQLVQAGIALAGEIPAVIEEVVKRAKLSQLRISKSGEKVRNLSEAALTEASRTMQAQITLLRERSAPKAIDPTTIDSLVGMTMDIRLTETNKNVSDLNEAMKVMAAAIKAIRVAVRA